MRDTFTLAHLSDLHLSSLEGVAARDLLNKRVYGYLMWQLRRRSEHRGEVLEALFRDLQSTNPDHIAITGDLTHLGLPIEFQKAAQWLQSLGPPSQITVIPGNHDSYVKTPWNRTFAFWASYMVSDSMQLLAGEGSNPNATFPSLRVRGKTALIGVCTARPSAPFLAVGSVGQLQLEKLEKILAETGQQQLLRVVLMHHPPVKGTVSWRKRLTDGATFRSVLAKHGAELVLHGHAHRTSLTQLQVPGGITPAVGVPSASSLGRRFRRRARYHIYHLSHDSQEREIRLSVRCYSTAEGCFTLEGERQLRLPQPAL
ncbi:MAG: metallophosphoesterase [Syntrophobacterales bacterium]|jgi:3',5'-cyclic AMP phosphodiesterase CpdA